MPSASPVTVSITVSHERNNTIHLSWEPPPYDALNGIIQGYQVIRVHVSHPEQSVVLSCVLFLIPPGKQQKIAYLNIETYYIYTIMVIDYWILGTF